MNGTLQTVNTTFLYRTHIFSGKQMKEFIKNILFGVVNNKSKSILPVQYGCHNIFVQIN